MSEFIELNTEGVRALLQSEEMMEICKGLANAAQRRCGDGYEVTTMVGRNRVNAQIEAVSKKAIKDNAKNNTILRSLR